MPRIRILPERVANQIAAGEVVERPAAVVKELVENALDAGATRIEVEFRQGGRALMRVEDNGQGMARDEALLALERHATSKIAEAADLDRLTTFGFRGEALPSIASVSRFTLQTRAAGSDVGTEIVVNGGKLIHVRDCGRPVGTSVEVAHLFHPVPARRKFLRSDATEAAHIVQCVRLYALACPATAFTLLEDGRVIFRSPECATLAERVGEIFGRQLAQSLIPINAAEGGLRLTGLIGKPGSSRGTRHETVTFVNGRPVDSRTLANALAESYRESLPKGRYPAAFVFLECNPAAVDVNVHPAKREVRFRNESDVRGFVTRSVRKRLIDGGAPAAPREPEGGGLLAALPRIIAGQPVSDADRRAPEFESRAFAVAEPSSGSQPHRGMEGPAWRFIGLAHATYALFEAPAGLILLDRRAAHERVWFERVRDQIKTGRVPSQRLLLPVTMELDPISSALLLDHRPFFNAHGFEIGEFGRHFFRVEAVPAWTEPADAEPFLRDILGAFREGRLAEKDPERDREELARLAATKAVRLPAIAGEAEMRALAAELFATRSPLASPSGRPTLIEISHAELDRRLQKR